MGPCLAEQHNSGLAPLQSCLGGSCDVNPLRRAFLSHMLVYYTPRVSDRVQSFISPFFEKPVKRSSE